jgi:glycosyl transferase family 25
MEAICRAMGFDFEIFPAVNGNKLSQIEIDKGYSEEDSIKKMGRPLARAEIGCAFSHITIYHKIIENNIPLALILEDDIDFTDDFLLLLNKLLCTEKNWECILLGHHAGRSRNIDPITSYWFRKKIEGTAYRLCRPIELACGTYGYLINESGAKRLLKETIIISKPIDHYTGLRQHNNLYVCIPPVIFIHSRSESESNLTEDRNELEKIWALKRKETHKKIISKIEHLLIYRLWLKIGPNIISVFRKQRHMILRRLKPYFKIR